MTEDKHINVGDTVEFTDEFGKQQTSIVIALDAYGMSGTIGIEGDYGCYVRTPDEVIKVEDKP